MVKCFCQFVGLFVLGFVCAIAPTATSADEKPARSEKKPSSKVDDELLKDLDNELLEGVGGLKDRPKAKDAGSKKPEPKDIGGEDVGQPNEDDPLLHISQEMRSVESLIPEQSKQAHAEQLQDRIIEDLTKLIEQAEKKRSASQSKSKGGKQQKTAKRQGQQQPKQQTAGKPGPDSNQPAQDSTERMGKSEHVRPDAQTIRGLLKDSWGHLPKRTREEMLQNSPEQFLPQYELMIERYYKRLAEERPSR